MASTTNGGTQIYDTVADKYASVLEIPGSKIVYYQIDQFLAQNYGGTLKGKAVLELACGTGDLLRKAQSLGATTVIGVDVSGEMVKIAQEIDQGAGVTGIEYHVADCGKEIAPLQGRGFEGKFDLVLGNWLFSYAQSSADINGMWQNVAKYLKPGGWFIGAFSGFKPTKSLTTGKYGAKLTGTGSIGSGAESGIRLGLMFLTDPPVEFDVFILDRKLYEEGAKAVGLSALKVEGPTLECLPPDELARKDFWQDEMDEPTNPMFIVSKPS